MPVGCYFISNDMTRIAWQCDLSISMFKAVTVDGAPPSVPLGAIPRSSRDGAAQARRACFEVANSVARGGPPAAAEHARISARTRAHAGKWDSGGSPSFPARHAPCARARTGEGMRAASRNGASRHRARRLAHVPLLPRALLASALPADSAWGDKSVSPETKRLRFPFGSRGARPRVRKGRPSKARLLRRRSEDVGFYSAPPLFARLSGLPGTLPRWRALSDV